MRPTVSSSSAGTSGGELVVQFALPQPGVVEQVRPHRDADRAGRPQHAAHLARARAPASGIAASVNAHITASKCSSSKSERGAVHHLGAHLLEARPRRPPRACARPSRPRDRSRPPRRSAPPAAPRAAARRRRRSRRRARDRPGRAATSCASCSANGAWWARARALVGRCRALVGARQVRMHVVHGANPTAPRATARRPVGRRGRHTTQTTSAVRHGSRGNERRPTQHGRASRRPGLSGV